MSLVAAVVVAAGRGLRAGTAEPKQFRQLGGEPVLRHSLATFARHAGIATVQAVIHPDDGALYAQASHGLDLVPPALGGATRQASVRAGLAALAGRPPDIVLVHDAARPFASAALVSRAIAAAKQHGAAVPALAVSDTVKSVAADGTVGETLERSTLRLIQTPQAFHFAPLHEAHRRAAAAGREDFTDDAALVEWAGLKVALFEGEAGNIKLTTPEDFARAEAIAFGGLGDVRTGQGIDVHAFGEVGQSGDHVTLGGVRIPHDRGLVGHSDADVVLHAIVDAILGALSEGDIGAHFPPSDPHRDAMRARIAQIAGIAPDRVAVKATTSEGLGFTGRGEGIAAFATATIRLPWDASMSAGNAR